MIAPKIQIRRAFRFLAVGAAVLLLGSSTFTLQAADPEGQAVPELKFDGTPLPSGTPYLRANRGESLPERRNNQYLPNYKTGRGS